jgi:MoxR-like ATPase
MATTLESAPPASLGDASEQQRLDALFERIQKLTAGASGSDGIAASAVAKPVAGPPVVRSLGASQGGWYPHEPDTFGKAGLSETEVENLILKLLAARSEASGRDIADHLRLPFRLMAPLLQQMKDDQLVGHRAAAMVGDYVFILTIPGRERAKRLAEHCTYYGAAPVPLADYVEAVAKQTIANQHPTEEDLHRAFDDLLIDKKMLLRLGPAINSGRGLFLFGAPGNGKTSIAERVTKAFGEHIWIPRAIGVDGELMRLFDPSMHEEAPIESDGGLLDNRKIDHRWVRIKRPTIVVGGELTMDSLEVTLNTATGVSESPVQMKSNCGTLVIDDFGRQRMTTDELLNRWIVPLEKRYDYLNLASGKKIQVPFDQLIIFSTNLEPKDLVDDAFLRRIPYKIEVVDPDEAAFRKLLEIMSRSLGVKYDASAVDYLVKTHYLGVGRPFRCCQPRDLLLQIRNYCHYVKQPPVMNEANFDFAVENYFAVM